MHSVSRLTDTWRNLSVKTRQQWYVINNFASYEGNYKVYRHNLKKLFGSGKLPNVLPYVGLYLRDLTALEEGSRTVEKGGGKLLL